MHLHLDPNVSHQNLYAVNHHQMALQFSTRMHLKKIDRIGILFKKICCSYKEKLLQIRG